MIFVFSTMEGSSSREPVAVKDRCARCSLLLGVNGVFAAGTGDEVERGRKEPAAGLARVHRDLILLVIDKQRDLVGDVEQGQVQPRELFLDARV